MSEIHIKPECYDCKTYTSSGTGHYRCAIKGSCPGLSDTTKNETAQVIDQSVLDSHHIQTCNKCNNQYLADSHEYPCPYCTPRDEEYEKDKIIDLVKELMEILTTKELSDNEREFHPTTISSCRVMHTEKLNKILPELEKLLL